MTKNLLGLKAGLKLVQENDDTIVVQLQNNRRIRPNPFPKKGKPYIGFIRFDEKYCPFPLNYHLNWGLLGVNIGDSYYEHQIEMEVCHNMILISPIINDIDIINNL